MNLFPLHLCACIRCKTIPEVGGGGAIFNTMLVSYNSFYRKVVISIFPLSGGGYLITTCNSSGADYRANIGYCSQFRLTKYTMSLELFIPGRNVRILSRFALIITVHLR